jgi:uncharacterized protein
MTQNTKNIATGLLFLVTLSTLNAASFDCKKAGTFIEHAICNDATLSKLDEDLAEAYKNAKTKTDKNALKQEQRAWMNTKRKACTTVECLREVYQTRLNELNNYQNASASFVGLAGNYKDAKKKADIIIKDNLWFSYLDVNERGNMCYFEGQLTKKGNLLSFTEKEYDEDDCKVTIQQINKNTVDFSSTGCQCGIGMDMRSGNFTRVK